MQPSFRERIAALRARTDDPDRLAILELLEEADERQQRSLANQAWLEDRLSRVENSVLFRFLRWLGSMGQAYIGRLGQILLRSPLSSVHALLRPASPAASSEYAQFLDAEQQQAGDASPWKHQPAISVLMAVCDPKLEWLQEAVQSVRQQTYDRWQLCICDDASRSRDVVSYLAECAESDSRILVTANAERKGISASLNKAAGLASGDYVAFLDHDDRLAPFALHAVAGALQQGPADVLYSDEDWMSSHGVRIKPNLKPDWSPDLLLSCMYMGHLLVVRREKAEQAGWFRPEYDGAQDYDLALRMTAGPATVRHIPKILYHWRRHEGSTAAHPGAKPHAHEAGKAALADALARRGAPAAVVDGPERHTYRVKRTVQSEPLVSIVVCSRNMKLFTRCSRALTKRTAYPWREVILVHHLARGSAAPPREAARVIPYSGPFNFALMNNLAVGAARGEVVVFLNDDVEPLQDDWLTALVAQVQRPEVGIVGAKLVYPRGNIQHAGMAVGIMDGAGHPGRGLHASSLWRWLDLTRNVSAVTGACMAIRRETFESLGGFDTTFPLNYNDVDLCLRVRQAGLEVIYEPAALLRHWEGQSRAAGTRMWEREQFHMRWRNWLSRPDPYYSPFFNPAVEAPALRHPSQMESR